jgi:hypothetical protein
MLFVNDVRLVPYTTLKRARFVSALPSTFVVGATHDTVVDPAPQVQVNLYVVLALIVASVCVP